MRMRRRPGRHPRHSGTERRSFGLAFAERARADGTAVFKKFGVRQYEQQPLAHRPCRPTFGTIEFAGPEFFKLLHGGDDSGPRRATQLRKPTFRTFQSPECSPADQASRHFFRRDSRRIQFHTWESVELHEWSVYQMVQTRVTASPAGRCSRVWTTVCVAPGKSRCGRTSASGWSTKRRSLQRGYGMTSPPSSTQQSPT